MGPGKIEAESVMPAQTEAAARLHPPGRRHCNIGTLQRPACPDAEGCRHRKIVDHILPEAVVNEQRICSKKTSMLNASKAVIEAMRT